MEYLKFYYWSFLLHIWWLLNEPEGVYTLPRVALKRAFVVALSCLSSQRHMQVVWHW